MYIIGAPEYTGICTGCKCILRSMTKRLSLILGEGDQLQLVALAEDETQTLRHTAEYTLAAGAYAGVLRGADNVHYVKQT